jgi:uncharacterized protein involved in response to NO
VSGSKAAPSPAPPAAQGAGSGTRAGRGSALWSVGFRPFYLLASAYACAAVLAWAAQYSGYLPALFAAGSLGHAHEMLFGFALAVMAGFLLTAVRNWTGLPTPAGGPLVALAALWLAGRVLVFTPLAVASAAVNAAFPTALAVAIGVPLVRARNARNYFFVGLLLALGAFSLAVQLARTGTVAVDPRLGLRLALDIVLFVLAVMGGRVIPFFTNNALPGAGAARNPSVEKLALGCLLLLLGADALRLSDEIAGALALAAAAAHAVRLGLWRPWRTFAAPLLWILHAGYAWIVVHLALRAYASLAPEAGPLATHALTVGAIGSLTLGMMVRSARGHTGRALVADRHERIAFVLVQLAALVRVFGGLLVPSSQLATVQLSALLWAGAFGLYAVRFWPVLTRPRVDDRPG